MVKKLSDKHLAAINRGRKAVGLKPIRSVRINAITLSKLYVKYKRKIKTQINECNKI